MFIRNVVLPGLFAGQNRMLQSMRRNVEVYPQIHVIVIQINIVQEACVLIFQPAVLLVQSVKFVPGIIASTCSEN